MSLHNDIMNIPCTPPADANINQQLSYKYGHRDARHAAAELVAQQDADKVGAPSNEREAFEEWIGSTSGLCQGRDDDDEYSNIDVHTGWQAWQARAELQAQPDPAMAGDDLSDDDIQGLLSEYGDHHTEHGRISYDKWTLLEAGRALLKRAQPATAGTSPSSGL